MRYLILETHPAYVVALDEEGRFLKAANFGYAVGDRVERIVPLRREQSQWTAVKGPAVTLAALAACFCLIFLGYYQPNFTPYGTLRMQINPDVEMTLSRTERVLKLEGNNGDGQLLIQDYDCRGKDAAEVTEDLMERAMAQGYLSHGETVSITVSSEDGTWKTEEENRVQTQLEERYGDSIVIVLNREEEPLTSTEDQSLIIPVPPQSQPEGNGDDDDDDSDNGDDDGYDDDGDNGDDDGYDDDGDNGDNDDDDSGDGDGSVADDDESNDDDREEEDD